MTHLQVKDLQKEPLHKVPPLQFWDSIRPMSKRGPGTSCSQNLSAFTSGDGPRQGRGKARWRRSVPCQYTHPSCARDGGSLIAKAVRNSSSIKFTQISKLLHLIIQKARSFGEATAAETIRAYITVKKQHVTLFSN